MSSTTNFQQHTIDFISEEEFNQRIQKKSKLRIKLGADPTAPDLHLGHAVVLHKLRQFQEMGHHIIFVIGDFTAMIGDPSGRSKVRKPMTSKEIADNAKTYFQQVEKILDMTKTEVRYNSEWLSKIDISELIRIMANFTLSQILARDDFSNRFKANQPIFFHEFLYPFMQAYDSVAIQADVELGGSDQTFNLLLGREMQQFFNQEPQIVITMPLLVGLDGTKKMSKSLNNYIGITENADEIFGKIMSIPDHLISSYYEYVLFYNEEQMDAIQKRLKVENPMELKMELATFVAGKYTSPSDGEKSQERFIKIFRNKDQSNEWQDYPIKEEIEGPLYAVLCQLGITKSNSESKRLIQQGGVTWDDQKITDPFSRVRSSHGTKVKSGKRSFFRLVVS